MIMPAPRTVLITGALGAVGASVIRVFRNEGYRIRVYDLAAPDAGRSDIDESFRGDINDLASLRKAMQGVDVVVHLAAKLHINNPDPSLRGEYQRVNVDGTRCVADAAVAEEVQRLVLASTICVYGSSQQPEVLDEKSPIHCDTWYAETKYEAEKIVLATLPAVVLRFAAVYGPQMKGNYVRLLHALQRGRFAYVGDGENRRTLVFDEDVARAIACVASHPAALGNVYNVTDGTIHSFREIVETMCSVLNRRPPRIHLPVSFVKAGVGAASFAARLIGQGDRFSPRLVDKITEDMAVSGEKIRKELGFQPRYDIHEGWRRVAAEQGGKTS
jgi:UDP-glucose 4-epimerase